MEDVEARASNSQPLLRVDDSRSLPQGEGGGVVSTTQDLVPHAAKRQARKNTFTCTIVLAKIILGAGMAALPRAQALLGTVVGITLLLAVCWLTHVSLDAIIRAAQRSGTTTFTATVEAHLGWWAAFVLQMSLVLRCLGFMLVYYIIVSDLLAGRGSNYPGLICDVVGRKGHGWCNNRPFILAIVVVGVLAPLSSLRPCHARRGIQATRLAGLLRRRVASTSVQSYVGVGAVLVWSLATLVLAGAAARRGELQRLYWFPDADAFGLSPGKVVTQVFAIIPIIATAYTCQMLILFVAEGLQPFSEKRMTSVSTSALAICTVFFLAVALGSVAVYGDNVHADVLVDLTSSSLQHLVGLRAGWALYIIIRVSFVTSVVILFPLILFPYREALDALCPGLDLEGPAFFAVTYATLVGLYVLSFFTHSIWTPLQLVGATAGSLIAFIFPAMLLLWPQPKVADDASAEGELLVGLGDRKQPGAHFFIQRRSSFSCFAGIALIVLGVLQCIAGIGVVFLPPLD